MQFFKLKEQLKDFIVFSLNDIRKIDSNFYRHRLNEWQNKGYIKKIRQGYYIFSDLKINEQSLFLIANKIYQPSYISLEMAFSYYNLIPESVYAITSITSQKTNNFKTKIGEFIYHSVKPELMFGYHLIKYQDYNFKIATIEKVILDYFYINSHLKTENDFFELRFNAEVFKTMVNKNTMECYIKKFSNKSLEVKMKKFLKFIHYA